jgi:hypothetical protein
MIAVKAQSDHKTKGQKTATSATKKMSKKRKAPEIENQDGGDLDKTAETSPQSVEPGDKRLRRSARF